jgi:cytochrome c oxidase subunit II
LEPAVKERRGHGLIALVALLGALAGGGSADSSIVNPKGSEADRIAGVWWLMFGLAAGVYVIVGGFILYASTRGRRRGAEPSRLRDNSFIWIGGVIGPLVILGVLAVVTVHTTTALRQPARNELRVDVVGKDWWWEVRYPAERIVTATDIYLPAGQPVVIRIRSDNVIHSFWVPELAGKMDAIPGQTNELRFTANEPGTYAGRCAEYCGIQHTHMGFSVHVLSPGDYGRWLARRQRTPSEPVSDEAAAGQLTFQREACAGYHTVDGTSAQGRVGPNLSDLGARSSLGAGAIENTPAHLEQWIRDAPSIKPGVLMPPFLALSDREVATITAYLESLK